MIPGGFSRGLSGGWWACGGGGALLSQTARTAAWLSFHSPRRTDRPIEMRLCSDCVCGRLSVTTRTRFCALLRCLLWCCAWERANGPVGHETAPRPLLLGIVPRVEWME